jgi:subtilisin family serine protease
MNKFTAISTKDYVPLSHKEEYFHNKYELIQSFLEKEFGENFANILALPQIKNREVDWHSKYKTRLKRVTEFSKAEQEQILNIYWEKINTIKALSSSFQNSNSDEKKRWANLLDDVFNSNNNIVFSDGENIVLLWGWKFNASEENYVPPPIISPINETEDHTIAEPIEEDNPVPIIPPDPIDDDPIVPKIPWYILFWEWIKKFFRRFWWILLLLLILWYLLHLDSCSCNQPKDHVEEVDENKEEEEEDPRSGEKNDDQEYVNDDGKNYIIIDDKEIIEGRPIPIEDPEKIIIDEEEGDYEEIISDRLFIAIKRESKEESILDFKKDFEKEYPDLKIIYYRKEAKLMGVQVPPEERVNLKKEIKDKFKKSGYDLMIIDEVIFTSSSYNYNDPVFDNANKNKRWHFDKIHMEDAWKITKGKEDVIIAIVDNGFDINHEDLKDNYYKPYNVYTQDSNVNAPNIPIEHGYGHGTHVAGISSAGINNRVGTAGIAPNCKYMPIQISDGSNGGKFTNISIIEGILYAINNGADVINLSLGKYFPPNITSLPDSEQRKLIETRSLDEEAFWIEIFEMANDENITIVLAAGNQDILTGIDAITRSKSTINVASVDDQLRKSDFSNYSDTYTVVSAPGGDNPGRGEDIYSCFPNNQYESMPGTSMAAPIISGVVALMKSIDPDITNQEIKDIFQETGKDLNPNYNIGPLVQVDKALKACGGTENPENNNEEERRRIEKEIKKKRDEIKELEEKLEDL